MHGLYKAVLFAVLMVSLMACCQQSQSATPPNDLNSLVTLKVCEQGVDECAIWILHPGQHLGSGQWKNGQAATLSYTTSKDTIVFQRVDTTGTTTGLTGTYSGTIDQDGFSGTFKETLPGKPERTGHWYASAAPPISLPKVIHFCGANCFTLTWINDHYEVTSPRNSWDPPDFTSIWTVETFTRPLVVLHRHDSANPANTRHPNGWDEVYRAQISGDGDTLVNIYDGKATVPNQKIRVAWGAALGTVPGSNAELAALSGPGLPPPAPVVCDWDCILNWGKVTITGLELIDRLSNLSILH